MDFRTQVLLSLQRALWGVITPDIRAIAVGWGEGSINARFIYEHSVSAADWETVREVETQVLADLDEGIRTNFTAEFVPGPGFSLSPQEEWWAYMRHEE